MKKRSTAILAGTLVLALLPAAGAGASSKGGDVSFNQVNLSVFSKPEIAAGETYRLSNGMEIPSTISYTNDAGGETTYIPIRMMAELLDADLTWDNASKTADFAAKRSISGPSDVTISAGTGEASGAEVSEKPVFGLKAGPFEEIDPDTVTGLGEVENLRGQYVKDTRVQYQYNSFPGFALNIIPEHGQYLVYTVTNNGETPQYTTAAHENRLGAREAFSRVLVGPGETCVRVFRVESGASPMAYSLTVGVGGDLDLQSQSDVTLTLEQYEVE